MNRRSLLKWLGVGSAAAVAAPVVAKVAEAAPKPLTLTGIDVDKLRRARDLMFEAEVRQAQLIAYPPVIVREDGRWSTDGSNWYCPMQ